MEWYSRACPVCRGNLHDDIEELGWATCFICARSFPLDEVAPNVGLGAIWGEAEKRGQRPTTSLPLAA